MLPQHHELSSNPYLIDRLKFMQEQEETYQVTTDYLLPSWTKVSPSDRRTMCSKSYNIVDAYSIDREVSCIAMTYFDRFMATTSPSAKAALMSRREFQLAFIACLIIALKYRAGMQVDSDVINTICQGMYNEKELIAMEKKILSALQWQLNGPSVHEFISGLLELMPSLMVRDNSDNSNGVNVNQLKTLAVRQVEIAMLDYDMAFRNHSSIAYAALLTAMNGMDPNNVFHPLDRLAWMKNIDMVMGLKTSGTRVLRDQLDHSGVQKGQIISAIELSVKTQEDDDFDKLVHSRVQKGQIIPSSTIDDHCFGKDKSVVPQCEDMQDDLHYCSSASSTTSSVKTQEDNNFDKLYPMKISMAGGRYLLPSKWSKDKDGSWRMGGEVNIETTTSTQAKSARAA